MHVTEMTTHAIIDALNDQAIEQIERDIGQVKALSDEALALAQTLDPPYDLGIARALAMQVNWYAHQGAYRHVIQLTTELQAYYHQFAPDKWLSSALFCLGFAFQQSGQPTEALKAHQSQLAVARLIKDREGEASALRRIGVAHDSLGDLDLALRYYRESRAVFAAIGDEMGMAGALNNMAYVHARQGGIEAALTIGHQALTLFETQQFISGQITAHGTLATAYTQAEQLDQANRHAATSVELARQLGRPDRFIAALIDLGEVLTAQKRLTEALMTLGEALQLAENADNRVLVGKCLKALSDTYSVMGDHHQALSTFRRYHDLQTDIFNEASQQRYENLEVLHQTAQAQAEAEIQRRLRDDDRRYYEQIARMKDEIVSAASHDLKNPLSTMKTMLYLVRHQVGKDDERLNQYLNTLERNIDQMHYLVVDMLDLARLEAIPTLNPHDHDLIVSIRRVVNELEGRAAIKHLRLGLETDRPSVLVAFDAKRIEQVLNNLIINAIKYTHAGAITVKVETGANTVVVRVIDSGIGIPENDLPHIFERFYRVDDPHHADIEGTGLGLAICQSIIEQHQGRIWVESVVGQGSVFSFELPI